MKRNFVYVAFLVAIVFGASLIFPVATAQQSQLINPGLELPYSPEDSLAIGIAHLPVPHATGDNHVVQEAVSAASTNTLGYIVRCPAADPSNPGCNNLYQWVPLELDTAYYHDVIIAAITNISGATDGETWNVFFTRPSGSQINIGPVSFSASDRCSADS